MPVWVDLPGVGGAHCLLVDLGVRLGRLGEQFFHVSGVLGNRVRDELQRRRELPGRHEVPQQDYDRLYQFIPLRLSRSQ